jgi:T5orf172 domain
MAGRTFMTKVWGFDSPVGPLQFSTEGWRRNAREVLQPGDIVVLVGTKGEPTPQDDRGRLLGIMEPTTEPVMSLDFDLPQGASDLDEQGNYKWPYGLLNLKAWRLIDRPYLSPDISQRAFAMDSAQGIVQLTPDEAARVAALRREEIPLLEPRVAARARLHGTEGARRRVSPPPTTTRRGVMHMRASSAYTYALEIRGPQGVAYKIGWAFDFKQRARQFNQAALPALGGVSYTPKLFNLWDTARQAFKMEQAILKHFERHRHRDNHEVLHGLNFDELQTYWIGCIRTSGPSRTR